MFLGERCTIARILLIIIRSLYLKGTAESTYTLFFNLSSDFQSTKFVASHGGQKSCENARMARLPAVPVGSLHVRGCQSVGKLVGRRVQFKQRKTIVRKLSNSGFLVDQNGLISVLNHLFKHQKTLLNAETQNQAIIHHSFRVLGRLYSLIPCW